MILTILTGGLGNQMFQYAVGRHLSLKRKTILKLHFANALTNTPRNLGLNHFNIHADIATKDDLNYFSYPRGTTGRIVKRVLQDLKLYRNQKIYLEKREYLYDPRVLTLPDRTCLEGYWQNQRYFQGIAEVIQKDFTFKNAATGINKNLLIQIKRTNSVSVHVRRGDYAANKTTHPILDPTYYMRALTYCKRRLKEPVFFIFSDDINWCKVHLSAKNIVYVDHNSKAPEEDLRLMSACKHNVIANSAFSWWGSWLNTNQDKITVAPDRWISNPFSKKMISKKWAVLKA